MTKTKTAGLFLLLILSAFHLNAADKPTSPFTVGERLVYKLKWGFITAGEAVLEVHPMADVNDKKAHHVSMTIRTTGLIDKIYRVRSTVESYLDQDLKHSVLYKKNQSEGKHKRDIEVTFDWEKKQAQYTNFGSKRTPVDLEAGTFDPFGVMYAFRLQKLKTGDELDIPVTDGKKTLFGHATVVKKKKIKVDAGKFDAYLVQPEIKELGGVFEKSEDATIDIWFSDDDKRIPLKVKSKVAIGSFVGELVEIQDNSKCYESASK